MCFFACAILVRHLLTVQRSAWQSRLFDPRASYDLSTGHQHLSVYPCKHTKNSWEKDCQQLNFKSLNVFWIFFQVNCSCWRKVRCSFEFFTIRISVRLSDRSKDTQNKINFVKNCVDYVGTWGCVWDSQTRNKRFFPLWA